MPRCRPSYYITTGLSLIRTALPIGAFYLTEILVGLTDLAVVGALGTTELAAVGLAKTILLSIMVVGFAILSIGTVLMAEHSCPDRCGSVVAASAMVALPLVVAAVLVGNNADHILARGGYDAALIDAFASYAKPMAWAVAPTLLFAALKNVLTAIGRTRVLTWFALGIVLGNLAGSVVLVHGTGTWAGLGVAGAAWSTILVNSAAAAILFVHLRRTGLVRCATACLRDMVGFAGEIVRLGWAAGAQQFLESILFIVVLYMLGVHSTHWLTAGTIVFAVMEVNYAMSGALGEVLAARVANARVAGNRHLIRFLLRLGGGMAGIAAALVAGPVILFAETVVWVFSSAQTSVEARDLTVDVLRWTAPFFLFDAWQIVFIHAMRGMRRTVLPMILSTACYWLVGLAGGAAMSISAGLGALGVWIGFCAGLTCAGILFASMASRASVLSFH